jgi:hypothetical protein
VHLPLSAATPIRGDALDGISTIKGYPRNTKRPGIPMPDRLSQISALGSLTPRQNRNRFEFLQRSGVGEFLLDA